MNNYGWRVERTCKTRGVTGKIVASLLRCLRVANTRVGEQQRLESPVFALPFDGSCCVNGRANDPNFDRVAMIAPSSNSTFARAKAMYVSTKPTELPFSASPLSVTITPNPHQAPITRGIRMPSVGVWYQLYGHISTLTRSCDKSSSTDVREFKNAIVVDNTILALRESCTPTPDFFLSAHTKPHFELPHTYYATCDWMSLYTSENCEVLVSNYGPVIQRVIMCGAALISETFEQSKTAAIAATDAAMELRERERVSNVLLYTKEAKRLKAMKVGKRLKAMKEKRPKGGQKRRR